ncbi:MAG TPA: hypothetical protein PLC42_01155 [Parachlamydiaceae bacterium]|nr:hypothetical protein [Parachlamydiaceae bacterium]
MPKKIAFSSEFDSRLFFGFLADPSFQKKIDPQLKTLFVQTDDSYLQEFFFESCLFFGKFMDKSCNLQQIREASLNILTLLQKLVPDHPYDISEFVLIATRV